MATTYTFTDESTRYVSFPDNSVSETTNTRSYTNSFQLSASIKQPNWRKIIASGNCATTPRNGYKQHGSYRPGWYDTSSPSGHRHWGFTNRSLTTIKPNVIDVATLSALESRALSEFTKNAQNILRAFDGLTFMGELGETLRQIKNPAKTLRKKLQRHVDFQHRKMRKVKRGTKDFKKAVSDSWLEAVFGWAPLLGDIDSGMDALTRWNHPNERSRPVFGQAGDESIQLYDTYTPTYGQIRLNLSVYDKRNDLIKFFGRVNWDPSTDQNSFKYYGASWRDILPTAWELIPYSFAVDYFTNIGDIVSAWSFGSKDLRWVSRTRYSKQLRWSEDAGGAHWVNSNPEGSWTYRPESINFSTTSFDRGQYYGSLVPDFTWEIPGVGSKKWLNLAALRIAKTSA